MHINGIAYMCNILLYSGFIKKFLQFSGIAMLFSAGTFLFVVQHVLSETTHDKQLRLKELIILVFGCFVPSLLTINHHH